MAPKLSEEAKEARRVAADAKKAAASAEKREARKAEAALKKANRTPEQVQAAKDHMSKLREAAVKKRDELRAPGLPARVVKTPRRLRHRPKLRSLLLRLSVRLRPLLLHLMLPRWLALRHVRLRRVRLHRVRLRLRAWVQDSKITSGITGSKPPRAPVLASPVRPSVDAPDSQSSQDSQDSSDPFAPPPTSSTPIPVTTSTPRTPSPLPSLTQKHFMPAVPMGVPELSELSAPVTPSPFKDPALSPASVEKHVVWAYNQRNACNARAVMKLDKRRSANSAPEGVPSLKRSNTVNPLPEPQSGVIEQPAGVAAGPAATSAEDPSLEPRSLSDELEAVGWCVRAVVDPCAEMSDMLEHAAEDATAEAALVTELAEASDHGADPVSIVLGFCHGEGYDLEDGDETDDELAAALAASLTDDEADATEVLQPAVPRCECAAQLLDTPCICGLVETHSTLRGSMLTLCQHTLCTHPSTRLPLSRRRTSSDAAFAEALQVDFDKNLNAVLAAPSLLELKRAPGSPPVSSATAPVHTAPPVVKPATAKPVGLPGIFIPGPTGRYAGDLQNCTNSAALQAASGTPGAPGAELRPGRETSRRRVPHLSLPLANLRASLMLLRVHLPQVGVLLHARTLLRRHVLWLPLQRVLLRQDIAIPPTLQMLLRRLRAACPLPRSIKLSRDL